jgi:hypothetical protein
VKPKLAPQGEEEGRPSVEVSVFQLKGPWTMGLDGDHRKGGEEDWWCRL